MSRSPDFDLTVVAVAHALNRVPVRESGFQRSNTDDNRGDAQNDVTKTKKKILDSRHRYCHDFDVG